MPTLRTFEKVNGSDKTKQDKKYFFKTPFWGTSKNRRLDPKVCADPSWLLVFKCS